MTRRAALGQRARAAKRALQSRLANAVAPAESSSTAPRRKRRGPRANPLRRYFRDTDGRLIHKWHHYFDIYHRHLRPYRGKPVTIVEFGVFHGGSLQMWKDYFGPRARIYGVDIDPRCRDFAEPQVEILIGDQEDRAFLKELVAKVGPIDVVIEDGGHTMAQQLATFEELWPAVTDGGVFLIEDLHTSYWDEYGGGHRRPGTFVEFAKGLIDQQHAWHSREPETLAVDDYTRSIRGMHVYDSVMIFDKGEVRRPVHEKRGNPSY